MNPENNNPLANPGVPDFGAGDSPANPNPGLSMADSLASAADNLTSAGMAANSGPGIMGLDQLGASNPEAIMAPPMEEPLVPAAPVPGSIGSVTSVPPIAPEAAPAPVYAPLDPNAYAANPVAPTDATQAPYNPFAQPTPAAAPATPSPAPAPSPVPPTTPAGAVNPAFQPAADPSAKFDHKSVSPLTIILGIVAVIFLIGAIVFFILWNQAKNSKEIVYVSGNNDISNEESNAPIHLLSCSRNDDYNYLMGYDHEVIGPETITGSYAGDDLKAISLNFEATFDSEADAATASSNLANTQTGYLATIGEAFEAVFINNGSVMVGEIKSRGNELSKADAQLFVYGSTENDPSVTLDSVKARYENDGFVCNIE